MSRPPSTPSSPSLTAALVSSRTIGRNRDLTLSARCHSGTGLLFFDLDDTIVQAGSHVSQNVLNALCEAREAGFVLSISSGRPLCLVSKPILNSGVMQYAICANGACVIRLSDGKVLHKSCLSRDDAICCYEMLSPYKPAWNAFMSNRAYFEWKGASYMLTGRTGAVARACRGTSQGEGRLRRLVRLGWRGIRFFGRMVASGGNRQVASILPHVRKAEGGIYKMGCSILDAVACADAEEFLRTDGRYEVVRMGDTELEITARGVTKGTGAQTLMEDLGIDRAHSVAFGDGGNDLPLVGSVGRFVAMGNADPEVKEAAFEVCPPVSEDGVAVWIRSMLRAGGLAEGVSYV